MISNQTKPPENSISQECYTILENTTITQTATTTTNIDCQIYHPFSSSAEKLNRLVIDSTVPLTPSSGDIASRVASPTSEFDKKIYIQLQPSLSAPPIQDSHGSAHYYRGVFDTVQSVDIDNIMSALERPLLSLPRPTEYYTRILKQAKTTPGVRQKLFYICRHGETEPNQRRVLQGSGLDESLNDNGLEQAKSLAQYLSNVRLDLIVSSHLKRAIETAEEVLKFQPNSKRQIIPDLKEIHWGEWEGQRDVDMSWLRHEWSVGNFDAKPPAGESPFDCVQRAIPEINELLKSPFSPIGIVAHGRLMRIILAQLLQGSLDNMSRFDHHNTCVNVLLALVFPAMDNLVQDRVEWVPLVLDDYTHVMQTVMIQKS